MNTDMQLRERIEEELLWEPSVSTTEIGIIVYNGVVTLTGSVETYPQKSGAERAALRVAGVKAVANQIEVKLSSGDRRTDEDIARTAAKVLEWNVVLPKDIQAVVDNGWITLTGNVTWQYQKRIAEDTVRGLAGVRGVVNNILVKPHTAPSIVKGKIDAALARSSFMNAKGIQVKTDHGKVTLEGTVNSFAEKEQAVKAAWSAPGVTEVDDNLIVN